METVPRRSHRRDATFPGPRSSRNDQTIRFRSTTIPACIPENHSAVVHIAEGAEVMANGRDESLALLITSLLDRVSMPEPVPSQLPAQSPSLPLLEVTSSDAPGSSSTTIDSHSATLKGETSSTMEGIVVFGPDGLVNSGTVPGLVKQLAVGFGDLKVEEAFRESFLTSYRAFTSSNEVLRLLVEQFKASLSLVAEQRAKVQYTIFSVLALWLDEDYVEATNDELLNRMREFVTSIQSASFLFHRQQLISLIDKNLNLFQSFTAPLTASPLSLRALSPSVPQDISPQVFAEVLTSIEGDRYRKLKGHDYVCHLEGGQEYNAVSSFMFENKKLTYWALTAILSSDTQSKRAEDLKKMLLVIKECKQLRNFSSACALAVGVTSASITCLKRTCGDLDKTSSSIFKEARALVHPSYGHNSYRAALGGSDRSCIPWLYVHRRDLKRIRTNQNLSEVSGSDQTERINFKRYRRVHEGIRKILRYQPAHIEPVNHVYSKARNSMEAQLAALIIDDVKLHDRRARLAAEEQISYDAYRDELSKAGFRVPSQTRPPPAARRSSARSRSSGTLALASAQMPPSSSSSPTDPPSFVQPLDLLHPSGPAQSASHVQYPNDTQSPPSSPPAANQPSSSIQTPPSTRSRSSGTSPLPSAQMPSSTISSPTDPSSFVRPPNHVQPSGPAQSPTHIQSPSISPWSTGQPSSPIQTPPIQTLSRIQGPPPIQSPNDDDIQTGVSPLDVFNRDSEHCLDGRIIGFKHITSGGNADIREGLFGDRKVAIKTIRPFSTRGRVQRDKLLQRLWREYSTWTRVSSHPIVLDCLGFTYDLPSGPYELPSLVSPWMSNGDLTEYIRNNPEADRLNILLDVAKGLAFLHEQNPAIIHGDLRGGNILITDSGRPCLSDFGLSKVLMASGMTTTAELGGTLRWMSPELIDGDTVSPESDVWAYAMTILEILSGHQPYHEEKSNINVLLMVKKGAMPSRSLDWEDLTNEIWGMCQKCWIISARQRPTMRDVCLELGSLIDNRT